MPNAPLDDKAEPGALLSPAEQVDVQRKVKVALHAFQQNVINIGGGLNVLAGLFVVYMIYRQETWYYFVAWYLCFLAVDVMNMIMAFRNRHITPEQPAKWKQAQLTYHTILAMLCLAWGSIVFLLGDDVHQQLYVMTFLELCIVSFSVGTVTDYTACIVSNIGLLTPYFSKTFYELFYLNNNINSAYCITILILSLFSLLCAYAGYRMIRKFFILSYTSVIISAKLKNANAFLEKRVKERTIELEDSLKLVTYQATHNLLTDLPNQLLLVENIEAAMTTSSTNECQFGLVFFSINEIEKINDGIGHQAGDYVLKAISQRLKNNFINSNFSHITSKKFSFAFLRQDTFVILVEPINSAHEIKEMVDYLLLMLDESILVENQKINLTASIGATIYPQHGENAKLLLMNTDAAMLYAKKKGGNYYNLYEEENNAALSKQLELESDLHNALKNKEFFVQFQPIVNVKTGKICSAEALVRWKHPTLGMIPPDKFISIAEANGLIIQLGEWVLKTACGQARIWHDLGCDIKIAVNLSSRQLQQPYVVEVFSNIFASNNLDPKYVELELTESIAFQKDVIPILKKLKAMGVCLGIDDFGTGYSGLNSLKLFDIDTLKIDKSFVNDVVTNDDSQAIVLNIISLAKTIKVHVLAEGVETKEQWQFLQDNGCDMIQGYYFSKPINADAFIELLLKNFNTKASVS